MISTDNEWDLVQLARADEPTAMRLIYTRYIRHLTAVCSRYIVNDEDVKDILQDCFIKIFASFSNFNYRGEGSLKAWLTKIVINEALKFIKRNRNVDFEQLSTEVEDIYDANPEVEQIPAAVIHSFIRGLPNGYRLVFNLYIIEGKTHKEISEILGIKESTSASQLHRAKALLAYKINEYNK